MAFSQVDAGGVLRAFTRGKVADATGLLREIRTVKVLDADGVMLRQVAQFVEPLTLSASPVGTSGYVVGTGVATTEPVTITPTGGAAPFTYVWMNIAGSGSADTPTLATTTFSHTMTSPSSIASGTFRVTVNDSSGQTATADVSADFTSLDFGGF